MNSRLFAIGDIHGCFDSLKELVENKIQLQKDDKLILLGDYIDRGDKSKEVVDFIIGLLENGFDVIPLMGNHEAMLLAKHRVVNIDTGCVYKDSVGYGRLAAFDCNSKRILLA